METNSGEDLPRQGAVRQFYADVFDWSWAFFDHEINGWVIYSKDAELPPRIITRRDRIDKILEGTEEADYRGQNIGVFEVESVEKCKEVVKRGNGKVMLEGQVDKTGLSNFAICEDDLGYNFTLVDLHDSTFSSSSVKKILKEPSGG